MVVEIWEFFGLILQNLNLICVIGIVETYLGFWGERLNFVITIAEIQPKVWERRRKRWKEKTLNFGNVDTEITLPNSASRVWEMCMECPKWKEIKNLTNKLWQCHCRKWGKKMWFRNLGRVKKKSVMFIIFSQ